ncbi:hypothetical protein ALC57_09435 [Trachymyrmex cornetzi]|uniref:Uncharacterized protein n=1 Tax=Trachymyrmex cornetzi TaxID=471704 RepID=A0A195DZM9_9HYME|nr:hypothetical protein ALC57_09435 [Trachymyrmex cornetzi]
MKYNRANCNVTLCVVLTSCELNCNNCKLCKSNPAINNSSSDNLLSAESAVFTFSGKYYLNCRRYLCNRLLAHSIHATGYSGADEWTHPVDPQIFVLVVHHGRTQTPSWIHAATGDGHRRHMSYRDRQADRKWGPTLHVGPLGIRDGVHDEHQQERDDYFHSYALSFSHFTV